MKNKLMKKKTVSIEDIERAAWYARLAFGMYQEKTDKQLALPKKSEITFCVMP